MSAAFFAKMSSTFAKNIKNYFELTMAEFLDDIVEFDFFYTMNLEMLLLVSEIFLLFSFYIGMFF